MTETKSKKITQAYCRKLLEKHLPDPHDVLPNSARIEAPLLAKILKSSDQNSRFMVSWDPDSFDNDDGETEDSYDIIGPGLSFGTIYYGAREYAEKERDALNNILREHFGNVTRTAEYTNDAYLAKSLLDCPCCPACGSTHTDTNEHRLVGASCTVYKGCHDCNAEWKESYALSGYKDLRLD
jgi:hypothetical protein